MHAAGVPTTKVSTTRAPCPHCGLPTCSWHVAAVAPAWWDLKLAQDFFLPLSLQQALDRVCEAPRREPLEAGC